MRVLGTAAAVAAAIGVAGCQLMRGDAGVTLDGDDIGGVVTGAAGPEAGVWVIAETDELPTRFAKIVVTDARGRYLVPDLPQASYNVWVRGYGLVDSPKVKAAPGNTLNLKAVPAPTPKAAAEYYPAIYWFSMLRVPQAQQFPLGPVPSQGAWLNIIKSGACGSCHSLGTPGMRTVPAYFMDKAKGNSVEAWRERLRAGSAQFFMARDINRLHGETALRNFADWTDRIAAGEVPFARPERPQGIERNLVITLWDWLRPEYYLHDLVSTDRRNPRVNPGGKVYGSPEDSTDIVPVLDPRAHRAEEVMHPVRDPATPSVRGMPYGASAYWGPDPVWTGKTLNHNPMFDEKGRIWFTSRIRPNKNPGWCASGHPSAKVYPLPGDANRHLSMYDPASGRWTLISTCFPTHHLNFARDPNHTLWTSPGVVGPQVIGWLNRRLYEQTGDEQRAQGWSPFVLDTNGNGRRDAYVQPDQPVDPAKDKRIAINHYSVAVSSTDGSVWGSVLGYPGGVMRFAPGKDPANTGLTEYYEPPAPAYGPRGGDIDLDGVFWVSLASGHLGQFDRRKCKVTNGPSATGKHCPEGWTLHQFPGPQLRDVKTPGSAEASYYVWVDHYGILGLGRNVPIAMGNTSDSIMPFVDGKFVVLRLPYPSGIFPKNVDGRIDDDGAGWKGRALWTTTGTRTPFHLEGGMQRPKAVKLQMRPDPLAR